MGTCVCEVEGQVLAPESWMSQGSSKGSQEEVGLELGRENFHFQAVYLAAQEEEGRNEVLTLILRLSGTVISSPVIESMDSRGRSLG